MDRDVIEQKIESLRRSVARVRLCVDIGAHLIAAGDNPPDTMGQTFKIHVAGHRGFVGCA